MFTTLERKVLLIIIIHLLVLFSITSYAGTEERLELHFTYTWLDFSLKDGSLTLSSYGFDEPIKNDWELKAVGVDSQEQGLYHLRRRTWKGFFLSADTVKHQVYKVVGKDEAFGQANKQGTAIEGCSGSFFRYTNEIRTFKFFCKTSSIVYTPHDGNMQFMAGGVPILDKDGLEIKHLSSEGGDNYQIRYRQWDKKFWQVNPEADTAVWWANAGTFGVLVGNRKKLSGAVVKSNILQGDSNGFVDQGFLDVNETSGPRSEWIESRKRLYRDILKNGSYDILVVPFQIQGYAVDRPGRSLMTRYLADRIAKATDARIPDATLVARAFGENSRMIDEADIYSLANELKVKTVIRGYVGHHRNEKMKLTLLVQKNDGEKFTPATKTVRLDWKGIPFSDEHPPEVAFQDIIEEVIPKLTLDIKGKRSMPVLKEEGNIALPVSVTALTAARGISPHTNAAYLQLLGLLFPIDTTDKEHLFERSLTALTDLSPQSSDYALIKARALFYLHRRPAALAALGTPTTPEGKAFMGLLNGNLPEMKEWVQNIKSPIGKLMAQIELFDLRTSYKERVTEADYLNIAKEFPGWEEIVMRRLLENDGWYTESNLVVKQAMDKSFPIPGFTADDLVGRRKALGASEASFTEDELSAVRHYQRYLSNHKKEIADLSGNAALTNWDHLDFLYAVSEANLLKGITIDLDMRGIYESALRKAASYESAYRGHAGMTFLKGRALAGVASEKSEKYRMFMDESQKILHGAYWWSGGQINIRVPYTFSWYDSDYPQRPHEWMTGRKDRLTLKGDKIFDNYKVTQAVPNDSFLIELMRTSLALKYTHDQFWPFESYHRSISLLKTKKEYSEILFEENKNRFAGNPDHLRFFTKLNSVSGDSLQKISALENAIAKAPDIWASYEELGKYYISQGDFKKAQATFLSYPLFKNPRNNYRVEMSNYAANAAAALWLPGVIEESVPLLEIAANSDTYSAAELMSSAVLALIKEDYLRAAAYNQQLIKRYDTAQGYVHYLSLLHILGFHKEAWSIFNIMDIQYKSPFVWTPAFIGHRMAAKTSHEVFQWLNHDHIKKVSSENRIRYVMLYGLTDRPPDRGLPAMIEKVGRVNPRLDVRGDIKYQIKFAEGYNAMTRGEYVNAYDLLNKAGINPSDRASIWPYYVRIGMKCDKKQEVDQFMKSLQNPEKAVAFQNLASAFYHGLQGRHQEAIQNLNQARYNVPSTMFQPLYPWYQLIETCELLYKDTSHEPYRALAVEWAQIHQRLQPWFAWAYAVEAKYTKSDTDRVRALALALYLDKNSERISGFTKAEKATALKWLEKNNPFLKDNIKIKQQASGVQSTYALAP